MKFCLFVLLMAGALLCVFLLAGKPKEIILSDVSRTSSFGALKASEIKPESQDQWYWRFTRTANAATERMYGCITEMYALGNSRGPVCREACQNYDALTKQQQEHPEYIAELGRKPVGTPKICKGLSPSPTPAEAKK